MGGRRRRLDQPPPRTRHTHLQDRRRRHPHQAGGDSTSAELLDRVRDDLAGDAVFNLDATAQRRFGYHFLSEYGNLFLENRYTDWGNYYPHWTLRNLWQLSRYLPARSLQMEFLNTWRNPDAYGNDDPFSPANIGFEFAFASTMVAQPLAWFEAGQLPEQAFQIKPLIETYRKHAPEIHRRMAFPIGREPDGRAWTGFQCVHDDQPGGYIIAYRQLTETPDAQLELPWPVAGPLRQLAASPGFEASPASATRLQLQSRDTFGFGLWSYGAPGADV